MEGRPLPYRTVDEIRALRAVLRVDIRLGRYTELLRRVRILTEDGLAADDDDLIVVCNVRGSANYVLQIAPLH
jgi:hypothetical protein